MAGFRSEVMVGRERELATLRELAASALAGSPATALLLGEAGIGKTRLALELAGELRTAGWLCVQSHGVDLAGGEVPMGAAGEMVRTIVRSVGRPAVLSALGTRAEQLASLDPGLGGDRGVTADRAGIMRTVLALVEGLGRPVCWVLDDFQWMDESTRDLAAYLGHVAATPLLVVATVRTDPATPAEPPDALVEVARRSTVIVLPPLSAADVVRQVGDLSPELSPLVVTRICEVSDGLPFFVEQLVLHGGEVTGSLRSVVLAGFRGLTPGARSLLAAAAVGEGMLTPDLLRGTAALGAGFQAALDEVRARGILRVDADGEELRFRHALLREALDSELLAQERRQLHATWADCLDKVLDDGPPDPRLVVERARHRYAAGGPAAFEAVLAAAEAADLAADDHARALWWERALELWPSPVGTQEGDLDRDRALARYFDALWSVGRVYRVARVASEELAGEREWLRQTWLQAHARTARRAAQTSFEPPFAPTELALTARRIRNRPTDFRSTWLMALLAEQAAAEQPSLAVELAEDVLREADSGTHWLTVARACWALGTVEGARHEPAAMVERFREAVAWTAANQPGSVLDARVDLSAALAVDGAFADAIAQAESNLAEIHDAELRPHLWAVQQLTLAGHCLMTGDWERAEECARLSDIPAGQGDIASWRSGIVGTVLARRGDIEGARQQLDRIPATPERSWGNEDYHRALLAVELAVSVGEVTGVRAALDGFAAMFRPTDLAVDVWLTHVPALRVTLGRGETDPGAREVAATTWRELSTRNPRGRLPACCSEEGRAHRHRMVDRDTAQEWAGVSAHWEQLGLTYDAAWCRVFEAECAARDGERDRATTALADAWSTADRLGAEPLRARVAATARRWRIDGVGRTSPAAGLTSRETEVLSLLAEGLTNAKIAERLFMSPKTASVHVSHVIAKLGVANRTEAAALAHRRGLVAEPPLQP